jgi:methylglutaconyl-CoA hydratase
MRGVSSTSSTSLRLERSGPGDVVARVTLARPKVHNAFDAALIADLRTTFAALAREAPTHLRAVVLAGDGPSFCAGADLGWMRAAMSLGVEGNEQDAMAMADMFETIDTCPVPVVARVQGAALGGGMGLCAVADVVIAESGTRFGFTETRLGILPSVISPFVIAKIGESHARALFPGGRRFDATRAARIGLVHEIVEGEAALDAAVEAAIDDLLMSGPTAARAAKAIVREVRGLGHGSAKWHTARVIARQRATEEAQEGFRAFNERRRPAWAPDEGGE